MLKKVILVLIFSLILCMIFTNTIFAQSIDEMIESADDFLKAGTDDAIKVGKDSPLQKTSNKIYNTLLVLAVALSVIVGAWLGIKFMIESAEDKAKIKESMIPFVVGCFIVFGAFGIWKTAVKVGNEISGDSSYSGSYTYTRDESGKAICGKCKEVIPDEEVRRGKCLNCGQALVYAPK